MHNVPSWLGVATSFAVHVTAPYITTFNGEEVTFTALIRDCDSGAGMIIDPDWSTFKRYTDEISSAGLGYSCVELVGEDKRGKGTPYRGDRRRRGTPAPIVIG